MLRKKSLLTHHVEFLHISCSPGTTHCYEKSPLKRISLSERLPRLISEWFLCTDDFLSQWWKWLLPRHVRVHQEIILFARRRVRESMTAVFFFLEYFTHCFIVAMAWLQHRSLNGFGFSSLLPPAHFFSSLDHHEVSRSRNIFFKIKTAFYLSKSWWPLLRPHLRFIVGLKVLLVLKDGNV